jgi:hypothetical protein
VCCFSQAAIEFDGREDQSIAARFSPEKTDYEPEDILCMSSHAATASLLFRNHLITRNAFPKWFCRAAYADRPMRGMLAKFGKFYCMPRKTCVYRCNNWGAVSQYFRGDSGETNRVVSTYHIYEGLRSYHEGNHQALLCRIRDDMGASAFEHLFNKGDLRALRFFPSWSRRQREMHTSRCYTCDDFRKLVALLKRRFCSQ